MTMELDTRIKLAVYRLFVERAAPPAPEEVAERARTAVDEVLAAYQRLRSRRLLALEADGRGIRMAPPFSGVATQHVAEVEGKRYYANCAWDALGIPAALGRPATVLSRCERSAAPLRLRLAVEGPEPCSWVFHSLVPAAHWWDDIVFT